MTFAEKASALLAQGEGFLRAIFPHGKVRGREFLIGNIHGEAGDSLGINMDTGQWIDRANPDHRGVDFLSLYARHKGISNGDAFFSLTGEHPTSGTQIITRPATAKPRFKPEPVVPDEQRAWRPDYRAFRKHKPVSWWAYHTPEGRLRGYTARYNIDGTKEFTTWQWCGDDGWQMVGFEKPRPLYGLTLLTDRPKAPVLIVEGEKACDAARTLCGSAYVVVTWPNGSSAAKDADWSPLYDRNVVVWPDADDAGAKAAQHIIATLKTQCPSLKLIEPAGVAEKWDAYDAVQEGMDWRAWRQWAKPLVRQIYPPPPDPADEAPITESPITDQPTTEQPIDQGSLQNIWSRLGLELRGNPLKPVCNLNNVVMALEGMPDLHGRIWSDLFKRRMYINIGAEGIVEYQDHHTIKLLLYFQRKLGMQDMLKAPVYDGVVLAAQIHKVNPVQNFINALPVWDGRPRIRNFFRDCYGATKSEYNESCSLNFWKSLAARALWPGCQVDNMVVLEGDQGIKKSSSLRLLVGMDWYASAQHDIGSKEFKETIQGKLLVEFSELATARKADVETIKQTITDRVDRFRVPWDRFPQDHPRQCIFVGSVNPGADGYLKDETGNRRFWPVKVYQIDLALIAQNKLQLWAEAVHRVRDLKEGWWEMPRDDTLHEQAMRMQEDAWKEPIETYLIGRERTTVLELGQRVLEFPLNKIDQIAMMRICRVLKLLGWEKIGQKRHDGRVAVCWAPTKEKAPQ